MLHRREGCENVALGATRVNVEQKQSVHYCVHVRPNHVFIDVDLNVFAVLHGVIAVTPRDANCAYLNKDFVLRSSSPVFVLRQNVQWLCRSKALQPVACIVQ